MQKPTIPKIHVQVYDTAHDYMHPHVGETLLRLLHVGAYMSEALRAYMWARGRAGG